MIHRSIREWTYLPVAEDGSENAIPRMDADSLVATAKGLNLGGDDGETILINGHRRLRAQQIVGVLASPGATLEILPKIDGLNEASTRECLVHMLARVFDLRVGDGAMADLGWQRYDLLEILIRLFCDRLFSVVHRGLSRRYVGHENDLAALRGRLNVKRQFTSLLSTPQKLACRYEDLSVDIPLNQIMKAAVTRLRTITRAAENQRRLTELAFVFADVSTIAVRDLRWDQVVLNRTNIAWDTLIKLAKMLLGERFQTTSSGGARGFSLMFPMNILFEEYIGRSIRRVLSGTGLNVQLQGPVKHALIGPNSAPYFRTKPDIVISRDGKPLLVIDTKWKRLKGVLDNPKQGVGQADVYQMMAYAHVYGCARMMLLYPHHDELGVEEGQLNSYHINGTEDAQLLITSIKISAWKSLESRLANLVTSALKSPQFSCDAVT
ncbi:MAG: 5-methylcytosine-specific restriction enzyme subunit McrC [Alphaproteobacteria bacterium]|jgi:5-methylcytosine-specific restriction enzyme subunit McrC